MRILKLVRETCSGYQDEYMVDISTRDIAKTARCLKPIS